MTLPAPQIMSKAMTGGELPYRHLEEALFSSHTTPHGPKSARYPLYTSDIPPPLETLLRTWSQGLVESLENVLGSRILGGWGSGFQNLSHKPPP